MLREDRGFSCFALFFILIASYVLAAAGRCSHVTEVVELARVESPLIHEASGMVLSRKNPGILWVHNDSGDSARLYALALDGRLVATFILVDVDAVDWEDIAIGPGPEPGLDYIYVADIGDNGFSREEIEIYRFPEPLLDEGPQSVLIDHVERIVLNYPDRAQDAETLLVDPVDGGIYIITKWGGLLYRASDDGMLLQVAKLPWGGVTGGDVSQDGKRISVRGYFSATLWEREDGLPLSAILSEDGCPLPLKVEPQGEAIAFSPDGHFYYTLSEGVNQPIYRFRLDD